MTPQAPFPPRSILRVPDAWIEVWREWADRCDNIADALVTLTREELSTHACVIGATGSGKSVALTHLIAADLRRGHSIVLLDPRGDLATTVIGLAAQRRRSGGRQVFFNLRNREQPLRLHGQRCRQAHVGLALAGLPVDPLGPDRVGELWPLPSDHAGADASFSARPCPSSRSGLHRIHPNKLRTNCGK